MSEVQEVIVVQKRFVCRTMDEAARICRAIKEQNPDADVRQFSVQMEEDVFASIPATVESWEVSAGK